MTLYFFSGRLTSKIENQPRNVIMVIQQWTFLDKSSQVLKIFKPTMGLERQFVMRQLLGNNDGGDGDNERGKASGEGERYFWPEGDLFQ